MDQTQIKEPSLFYIALFVVGLHLTLLFWFSLSREILVHPKRHDRLVVKTISLKPQTSQPVSPSLDNEPAQPSISPPSAKIQKKSAIKKTPVAKPKPIAKKIESKVDKPLAKKSPSPPLKKTESSSRNKQKQLVAKAQESIAKIQRVNDKVHTSKVSTSTNLNIPQLKISEISKEELKDTEISYRDELAARLKLLLRLPEYGEVKIKLTIGRLGNFIKMVITKSESEVNASYLEKNLPNLTFPAFGDNFKGASDYIFSITLSNLSEV